MRIVLAILAVTVVLLIIETASPISITEDMIFSYKHELLLGEAETIASSLNTTQNLSGSNAQEVMDVLGSSSLGQVVITDADATVLYSSNSMVTPPGLCAIYPEVVSALRGNDAFRCIFTGDTFESYCAVPIVASGVITGCVYVVELDQEQAALLSSIQSNAVRMMVLTVLVSIFAYLLFGVLVTTKNQRLLQSFRLVRQGDYAHRVQVKGHDEYALLASEFNTLTDRLQDIEEKRRQFVSDASHELRTPLAAMRLLSDSILQNEMDMDTVREFVQDISSEADRLTRMTSKLLNLTALDSRQFETAEPEIVDLGACCKKAVRMLSPFAQELGAQIEQSSEENCCVSAREDDIFQLVLNLAENGLKYSQKGGQVRLIAYTQGETAVLIVEDNGVGIPEEELERIFERFYRVDKARSREAGGTGLGLAIVRETAEKFGGTVSAANRPQGGARFTVKFPRCKWEGEP
jgi:signal transduction histidine kinase